MNELFDAFFDYFGFNTTTNFDLIKYAKILKITNFHYAMTDEIKELPLTNFNAIINYQLLHQKGSHHVGLVNLNNKTKTFYFDSFGKPIQKEVLERWENKLSSFDYEIQPWGSNMCGQISLLIIWLLNKGHNFENIILNLMKYFSN